MQKIHFDTRKSLVVKTLVCIASVLIGCHAAYGQMDTAELEGLSLKDLLNMKITTASKTSEASDKAAATVIVITAEQIKMRGYHSLLDVLYDLPDMKVDDKLYTLALNNFTFRGIPGQDKFILLLDGVRISSPTNEAMPIMENYPVNLAEQIEVVYGPASALYGADAVSGVINIITKKGSPGKDLLVEGSSSAGMYGSSDNSLFIAKKLGDQMNLVVSGQYFYDQQPDYTRLYGKKDTLFSPIPQRTDLFNTIYGPLTPRAPLNPRYQAPMSAYNLYAALQVRDFSLAVFSNYARTPTSFGNNTNNNVYNANVFAGQHVTMVSASYKSSLGPVISTSSLMTSRYVLDPASNTRTVLFDLEPAYLYSTGSMSKLEEQLDWKVSGKLTLTGGASYAAYNSTPDAGGEDEPIDKNSYLKGAYQGTDSYYQPDGLSAVWHVLTYNNIGTYLQTQYSPVKNVDFTLGARYDIDSRYGNTLDPRLGIVYKPSTQTTVKALYGSAFLAPSPAETYLTYGALEPADSGRSYSSKFMHLPNPGLRPIISHNLEFSIRQYLTNDFSVTFDGYYTLLTNLPGNADDNKSLHLYNNLFQGAYIDSVEVTINQGKQKSYGGSLQLNYQNKIGPVKINAYAQLSFIGGTIQSQTIHLAQLEIISPYSLHIGADLRAGKLTCSPRLILMDGQHLTGFSDTTSAVWRRQTIPGYALLDISAGYNLAKKLSLFADIHNALNRHYRNVGADMDLNTRPTAIFYGQHEDPVRIMGGIRFTL
jgi:outer membrane receptor for ferrienterochelin and colicin